MSIKYNGGYIPAVGADGTTLVANSASATGVAWAGPSVAAGKNVIINGGFDIWQRGTTSTANATYTTADRWWCYSSATTFTWSQNSTAPTGLRYSFSGTINSGSGTCQFQHAVETANTIPLAGQTATLSFYLATTGPTGQVPSLQFSYSTAVDAGLGGSYTTISGTTNYSPVISGSFQRYSITYTIPSTAKSLMFVVNSNSTMTTGQSFSLAGVQLELGSTATTFSRAGGTIGGELALCQRYYNTNTLAFRSTPATASSNIAFTTYVPQMRTSPTFAYTSAASASANISGTPALDLLTSDGGTYIVRLTVITTTALIDSYYVRSFSASAEL